MAKNENPNFTAAQVALISETAEANNGKLTLENVKALANDPRMNKDGEPRNYRSIVAKISTMIRQGEADFTYERKQPTTKNGEPIQKKIDLVSRIASAAGVTVAALDGLDKAPKATLETLARFAETA